MVQSLEEYVAQATNAYRPATTAIQNQLNSLSGQLEATNKQINKNYARQQDTLNQNRNMAAESASMQAAGSGGSFGGSANIANRKYYDQTFVPAQAQLQTNQANELAQARQNSENQRLSLQSQMANIESQANNQALQQYWAAVEAEKERQEQARRAAAARAAEDAANRAQQAIMNQLAARNNKMNTGVTSSGKVVALDPNKNSVIKHLTQAGARVGMTPVIKNGRLVMSRG